MSSQELVSVIIPTHNYGDYVADAVKSVLAQTYQTHEIIVVDDGSTDHTREALEPYLKQITYIFQNKQGASAARNTGIRRSQGHYIAFLDADDIWLPHKLDCQVRFLREHESVGLVFGQVKNWKNSATDTIPEEVTPAYAMIRTDRELIVRDAFKLLLDTCYILTSTVLMRRKCVEKVGLFDESLGAVEDRDLWLRIAMTFPIAYMEQVIVRKRGHNRSFSQDFKLFLEWDIRSLLKITRNPGMLEKGDLKAIRKRLAEGFFQKGASAFFGEEYKLARKQFRLSLANKFKPIALLLYVCTFVNRSIMTWVIGMKRRYNQVVTSKISP
jgi:glycosyltransferase involved in cell wall biosynthesis